MEIWKKGFPAGREMGPLANPTAWNAEVTGSRMGKPQNTQILGPRCWGGRMGQVVALGAPKTARPGDIAGDIRHVSLPGLVS